MATINFPGLFTGIDTNTLISQLITAESGILNMYKQRETKWENRKDALDSLESKLMALSTTVKALSDADQLRAFNVTSSDEDILAAEATSQAFEGNHTVRINQLATADRWVHTAGLKYADDYVSADAPGTFIYSYNGKETAITTTTTTTLEDLVGLINNDADNPGVTASLLNYGGAYHLVLNGNNAGSDYRISVNTSSTQVLQSDSAFTVDSDNATLNTRITELDWSGVNPPQVGDIIRIAGADHYGKEITTPVEIELTANTKLSHIIDAINQAFDGNVKATLENGKIVIADGFSGTSGLSVTLTYDLSNSPPPSFTTMTPLTQGGDTPTPIIGFSPSDFTRSQVAQDSKIKVDGFPSVAPVPEEQQISGAVASGTFTLSYGGYTTDEIAYSAITSQIQDALDALPSVQPGDIEVTGTANGGDLKFKFKNTLGDVSSILINSPGIHIDELTKGVDEWISRSSNTVDDVLYGVTLHLHDVTDPTGEEITLTRDIASVKDKLSKMVDAYNAAIAYIKEKTGYNNVLKTGGLLMGDYVVSTINSQLSTPLIAQTAGFIKDIDSFQMPGQIGLELNSDGTITFDSNAFDEAIAKDYMGTLAIIGADKTGSSDSNTISFYGASSNYTTAGTYDVKVTITNHVITDAQVKLHSEGESAWRQATFSGNTVTGDSSFDDNGDPIHPENGLLLSVDLNQGGTGPTTYTATVRVKQGFAGAMQDALDKMLKATTGSIDIDQKYTDDTIKGLQDRIDTEQTRLTRKQQQLIAMFARLEGTLALLQNQMAGLGMSTSSK
jgi:flagellar capping protein FliD